MPFECDLVKWLNEQPELKDAPASTLVPASHPKRFITVERTGGRRTPLLDRPSLAIQCWAESQVKASDLADTLADVVLPRVYDLPYLGSFAIDSIYDYPLDGDTPRYQITASAVVHTAARAAAERKA